MTLKELKEFYLSHKPEIRSRLKEFAPIKEADDRRIAEELFFCILTANASARMGINCIERIRPIMFSAGREEISRKFKGHYRFWKTRAEYIEHTRDFLKNSYGLKMKKLLGSFSDRISLRDFFAMTKDIKVIGFKEASHFLRNIGYKGYAILDKHIVNCLYEYDIIGCAECPRNRREYLEIEEKMKIFAKKINIDFDELDLLFWSSKTGEILK
jgi:N-glycosylase/DNA lyase